MTRLLAVVLALLCAATSLTACALPGKPGPAPSREYCTIDQFGARCTDTPPAPGAEVIRHE